MLAAGGARLIDFSFHRTQGIDAGLAVARASAIAGFAATSNAAAARRYGLATPDTMAPSSTEALGGVRNAIEVIRRLRLPGPVQVRLDSGGLAAPARQARQLLDEAGLGDARICVSGGLDEYVIAGLVAVGAPIDVYGVGTKMGVCADAPYLDSVYELVAYGDRPVTRPPAAKGSAPGAKQVYRGAGGDVLALRGESPPPSCEPLLVPVMREGRRLAAAEPLSDAQRRCRADLAWLPPGARALRYPEAVPVRISKQLKALQEQLPRAIPHARPGGCSVSWG